MSQHVPEIIDMALADAARVQNAIIANQDDAVMYVGLAAEYVIGRCGADALCFSVPRAGEARVFRREGQGAAGGGTCACFHDMREEDAPEAARELSCACAVVVPLQAFGERVGALAAGYGSQEAALAHKGALTSAAAVVAVAMAGIKRHGTREDSLLRVLDELTAHVMVVDIQTDEILYVNRQMREDYGLTHDAVGKPCSQAFGARLAGCPAERLDERPGRCVTWEEHNEVTGRHYKNTDTIIRWRDGHDARMRYAIDVTTMKHSERSLTEAKQSAEMANKAKGNFLSRISHEIRTPINAVIGMARIALESTDEAKRSECLGVIDASAKSLLAVVNDILDASRIEAHNLKLSAKPFDFERMLIRVVSEYADTAEKKRRRLHVYMNLGVPRVFVGDEQRIAQVVAHLLSNAVKFTPQGGTIRVSVAEKARKDQVSTMEVSVADTGVGIPDAYKAQLFTSFGQADDGSARMFGGAGLGLSISRSIVQLMGGDISVVSEQGKGSTFTFTVALKSLEEEAPRPASAAGAGYGGLRVLFMDSSEEVRGYFEQIMAGFGASAATASTMDAFISELNAACVAGNPFRVAFYDAGACAAQRAGELKRQFACEMIAVGAPRGAEDDAGVRRIQKPLFPAILHDVLCEFAGVPPKSEAGTSGAVYLFSGYTILLVEDNAISRGIMAQALADTKVRIENAVNGRAAVEMFAASPGGYDLILMDIHMPEMDGYEATRTIRALPVEQAGRVPIIALSANNTPEDVRKCHECGMNGHLAKPVEIGELLSTLHRLFNNVEEGKQDAASWEKSGEPLGELASSDLMDIARALERVKGNKRVLRMLLTSFAKNTYVDTLSAQVHDKDVIAAEKTLASLHGAADNLYMVAVTAAADRLEARLRAGGAADEALSELQDKVARTVRFIESVLASL